MAVVVKIELWPGGDERKARPLGCLTIVNDGTGTGKVGHYDVEASHAGVYLGKRKEPYKTARVSGFARHLSPYRLVCRALQALRET